MPGRLKVLPDASRSPERFAFHRGYINNMFSKKRNYLFLLLIPLLLFIAYVVYRVKPFSDNQWSDQQLTAAFSSGAYGQVELGYLRGSSRKLRFLQIGQDSSKPLLVFIHGSPSSSSFWVTMMRDSSLRSRANLLAIDRPGYGGSGLGIPMISVREQAENVAAVIAARRMSDEQPVVVHGSSYGGTVSARIAMDYPEIVDGLLLQSASMAPREEYTYWITHPTSYWPLSKLIPSSLSTANNEKLSHEEQLEEMVDEWDNIDASTVILHGTDDWLIYPPNAYFACDQLINAEELVHHMVDKGQHDLIFRTPKLLKRYLHKLLNDVTNERIVGAAAGAEEGL